MTAWEDSIVVLAGVTTIVDDLIRAGAAVIAHQKKS
jgi:hypothetical protein